MLNSTLLLSFSILLIMQFVNHSEDTSVVVGNKKHIGYYITGHGFGHATRSIAIILKLLSLRIYRITIVSAMKPEFFKVNLRLSDDDSSGDVTVIQKVLDTGAIQEGPLKMNPLATLETYYDTVYKNKSFLIAEELEYIKKQQFDLIITDTTALICKIGKLASVPSIILSNFTWDFIYKEMLSVLLHN